MTIALMKALAGGISEQELAKRGGQRARQRLRQPEQSA